MGIQVGDNFDHKSKKPLDNRTSYATLEAMKAVIDANIYEGCEAYCVETDKYYKFKSTNTVDASTGKWREREGGGTTDYSELNNKPSINDTELSGNKTASELGLANINDIPNKLSDLTNDAGFITNTVNNLINYYLKTELYTKSEVDSIVTAIKNSRLEVVATLPTTDIQTNVIYLVPSENPTTKNVKDEYVNLDGTTSGWECIGSTLIDLSNYVTIDDLNTALANYVTSANLATLLAEKQDKMQFSTMPTASEDYLGKTVQYVGRTTATYTHNYFYECVSDGEATPTYSWVVASVQDGSGSYTAGDGILIDNGEISTDNLQEGDMDDIIHELPTPSGDDDYEDFIHKPSINSVTLIGDKTSDDLGLQGQMQFTVLPTASADYLGKTVQYIGATENGLTHNFFYECVSDGESTPTYSWVASSVQEGGGSGDASLETDITTNLEVGAIPSGTTLTEGMTFTEVMQKLFITEIAPTITFSASESGVKEVGTSVTPTLTLTISDVGTGTPVNIKFYDGSTLLNTQAYVSGTNTYTYTMSAVTTTKTVKGVLEYKKSDNTDANVEKSATYTFVMASYYGAVTTAPTDKAGITALTKNVKTTKAQTATFTLSNQRSCYCYPASMGDLTSIKDANNFEYLSSYTKTNVTVDGTSYNVYTLTDPVTATGFKQVYA